MPTPTYLPSNFPTTLYPSSTFLESAGCILFDFRHTTIDPFNPPSSSPSPTTSSIQSDNEPNILLIYSSHRKQYLLPKGRRNISEPRTTAALRESLEETGLRATLLPVTLHSRATSSDPTADRTNAGGFTLDEVRTFHRVTDPFMLILRQTQTHSTSSGVEPSDVDPMQTRTDTPSGMQRGSSDVMKLIWYFIGVVDSDQGSDEELRDRQAGIDPGCEIFSVRMSEAVERCSFEDDARVVRGAIEVVETTMGWDGMGWEG